MQTPSETTAAQKPFELNFKRSKRGNRHLGFYLILAATVAAIIFVIATSDPARRTETVARASGGDMSRFYGNGPAINIWGLENPKPGAADNAKAIQVTENLVANVNLTCKNRDVDDHGRITGQCKLPDGRDLADELICFGVASETAARLTETTAPANQLSSQWILGCVVHCHRDHGCLQTGGSFDRKIDRFSGFWLHPIT